MLYTPAEANKLLRSLQDREQMLLAEEEKNCTFVAAHVEDPEKVRPDYNFIEMKDKLARLKRDILEVKHAINRFNVLTEVPGTRFTVDQLLVLIPKLKERQWNLRVMASRSPSERIPVNASGLVEYRYANYDVQLAKNYYEMVSAELDGYRIALDTLNNTAKEIKIDSSIM